MTTAPAVNGTSLASGQRASRVRRKRPAIHTAPTTAMIVTARPLSNVLVAASISSKKK